MDDTRVIDLRVSELREIIRDELRGVLAERESAEALLDLKQAAELLKVHPRTVSAMVRRDGLPALQVGQSYRFRRSEVLAWLEQRSTAPGAHGRRHRNKLAALRDGETQRSDDSEK